LFRKDECVKSLKTARLNKRRGKELTGKEIAGRRNINDWNI
jgi:hypothetical protein